MSKLLSEGHFNWVACVYCFQHLAPLLVWHIRSVTICCPAQEKIKSDDQLLRVYWGALSH